MLNSSITYLFTVFGSKLSSLNVTFEFPKFGTGLAPSFFVTCIVNSSPDNSFPDKSVLTTSKLYLIGFFKLNVALKSESLFIS